MSNNRIVQELLNNKDNYAKWRSQIKAYLISQDLWDVVDVPQDSLSSPLPQQNNELSLKKRNGKALHAIMMSCGSEALSAILTIEKASVAWAVLETEFSLPLSRTNDTSTMISDDCESFHKALIRGDWRTAKRFLDDNRVQVTSIINHLQENALHVAAYYGHDEILEELLKMIPDNAVLEVLQKESFNALTLAVVSGNMRMVKLLVKKNPYLARVKTASDSMLPIMLALNVGQIAIARYLYPFTELEDLKEDDCFSGQSLVGYCILCKAFDIALDLVKRCPEFIMLKPHQVPPCFIDIAKCTSAFPSGTFLAFWQRWIYNRIDIQSSATNVGTNISGESNSSTKNDTQINMGSPFDTNATNEAQSQLQRMRSYLYEFFGLKKMYDLKLMHIQSKELLQYILGHLTNARKENKELVDNIARLAMISAVEEGNVEFIVALVKAIPETISGLDHTGRTVFSYAVEFRQEEVFSLLHGCLTLKQDIATFPDDQGDTVLHVAGKLAPPSHLSHISGAALQMQRELQWFREVERVVEHNMAVKEYRKNKKHMNAREYFTENHKKLATDGEKWMKEIARSSIFVLALIVTIMFAAAFVVPGGTEGEGDRSLRVISHQKWFLLYIISDSISLFSSTTSVLMFLGILTSRYYEDAFLISLPTKLIVGLSTLFFSIATMMIAFCAALYVMLQGQLTILVPVILLACVPVSMFVKLQFPLLVEIFVSTYGRGIFTRKYDKWLLEE